MNTATYFAAVFPRGSVKPEVDININKASGLTCATLAETEVAGIETHWNRPCGVISPEDVRDITILIVIVVLILQIDGQLDRAHVLNKKKESLAMEQPDKTEAKTIGRSNRRTGFMTMNAASKKIEVLANITIITISLLLGIVLVKTYFLPSAPRARAVQGLSPGKKVPLSQIDWSGAQQTILVVLAKGCNYCAESAPFYQRLASKVAGSEGLRLIAVLPQPPEEARRYLDSLHVPIENVVQAELASMQVEGTPTLILVDSSGVVKETWVGKLPTEAESEVLSRL